MSNTIGPSSKVDQQSQAPRAPTKGTAGSHKAQHKVAHHPPTAPSDQKRAESSTSFSEIMREATDGDATEQIALAAIGGGQRQGGRREDRRRDDRDGKAGASSGSRQQAEADEDDTGFDPLERLRARAAGRGEDRSATRSTALAAQQAQQADSKPDPAQRMSKRHETLMVVASAMQPRQIATHVSQQVFEPLVQLLSQPLWSPVPDGHEKLVAAQMRATNKHVAR